MGKTVDGSERAGAGDLAPGGRRGVGAGIGAEAEGTDSGVGCLVVRDEFGRGLETLEERLAEIEVRLGLHTWLLTIVAASTVMPAVEALFGS